MSTAYGFTLVYGSNGGGSACWPWEASGSIAKKIRIGKKRYKAAMAP
jgi:hypothetical protein